ncbi:MAG: hypothetical protein ACR2JI_03390 [Mycobacterium sp.]
MARFLRTAVLAVAAGTAALSATVSAATIASADTVAVVSPGMEIRQGGTMCTLGFVDPVARVAFSAGHCNASGPVTDRNGRFIGVVTVARDNTPDGTVVRTDQVISDYETISLASDVTVNTILPSGRTLVADVTVPLAAGQPVCHFGIVTGESCGTIERVNNGWFTMDNGVVSQKGDSGGPVYTLADDGKAVVIGLFNSTWGRLPAAVSWQATGQQLREDTARAVVSVAAAPQR